MKIDPETRHQKLAQHIKFHLSFVEVDQVKFGIVTMMFCIYDLALILGLLSIYKMEFLWMVLPFIVILHLWGARLVIKNPYSTQLETVLFLGVWGLLGAISLWIMVQGMSYYNLHITSVIYYILIHISILLLGYIMVKYQFDKYSGDPMKERKASNQSKYYGLLDVAPAMGYIIAQTVSDTVVLKHVLGLVLVYSFTVLMMYIGAKFLHRYFFIKLRQKTPTSRNVKGIAQ
ncbi:hypothetical protein [Gracilibacillus phocaeensis]|uniref:hypothetical protein n=1 Tax=Gracilibacillus phocaeensis TaxID=2042304 RepID=UPI001031B1DD|nr:hypothetical protein [Gracilibacillus phocaeensis]